MPGQGLAEKLTNERFAEIGIWLGLVVGIIFAAGCDAVYRLLKGQPQSWVDGAVVVVAAVIATRSTVVTMRAARREKLGMQGEISVAQTLEQLAAHGYRVLHDLQPDPQSTRGVGTDGTGPNIDHVVIGPAGVFVIETKTASKPVQGGLDAVVRFNGSRVLVNGHAPDRDPLAQVRAAAGDVARYLKATANLDIKPRPVLLYPGWFVKSEDGADNSDVWVLNDIAFLKWVQHADRGGPSISAEVVALAVNRLALRT